MPSEELSSEITSTPTLSPFSSPRATSEAKITFPSVPSTAPSHSFPVQSLLQVLDNGAAWYVEVKEVNGERLFELHSNEVIHPASIIKVPLGMLILYSLEKQSQGDWKSILDHGPSGAGRSYRQLLRAMLVYSEEDATEILEQDLLAQMTTQEIHNILSGWGISTVQFRPRRASIHDLSKLLECLYNRQCLNETASEQMLEWLAEETPGDKGRLWELEPLLPEGSRIFNKRGSMTVPLTVGDCGIVEIQEYPPLLICIVGQSQGEPNFDQLHFKIGEFVRETWYLWKNYREIKDE